MPRRGCRTDAIRPEPVRTERLVLRAPEPSDAPAVIAMVADPAMAATLEPPLPRSEADVGFLLARPAPDGFCIVEAESGPMVGMIFLHSSEKGGTPLIGYWIGRDHQRRG